MGHSIWLVLCIIALSPTQSGNSGAYLDSYEDIPALYSEEALASDDRRVYARLLHKEKSENSYSNTGLSMSTKARDKPVGGVKAKLKAVKKKIKKEEKKLKKKEKKA